MKIFILHHTPAHERKIKLQEDLRSVNLQYPIEWVEKFLPTEIDGDINHNIKLSELSLSLKHRYVHEQIVQHDIPYGVVFEDDVDLLSVPELQQFIEISSKELIENSGDVLWIGDAWSGKYVIPSNKRELHRVSYFSYDCYSRCTHAYIVTNHGAKLILDNYNYNQPVDHFFNEIISNKKILPGWTETGLKQKSAEGLWSTLIH